MFFALSTVDVSGLANTGASARLQLFLEVLLECGFNEVRGLNPAGSLEQKVQGVVRALVACGEEILDPDSVVGGKLRAGLSKRLGSNNALSEMRNNRAFAQLTKVFKVLKVAEALGYLIDLGAEALVGDLRWTVRGQGRGQGIGNWHPTCDDIAEDAQRLYRNLVLDDRFTVGGSEDWYYLERNPQWEPATKRAVTPLTDCSNRHRTDLADNLKTAWNVSPAAYRILRDQILALNTDTEQTQPTDDQTPPPPTGTTISVRLAHSCGVREDGTVVCWGLNHEGSLDAPSGTFTSISVGWGHSCGIRGNGTVACWGNNEYGQLDAPEGRFTAVSAGSPHSCGLRGGRHRRLLGPQHQRAVGRT